MGRNSQDTLQVFPSEAAAAMSFGSPTLGKESSVKKLSLGITFCGKRPLSIPDALQYKCSRGTSTTLIKDNPNQSQHLQWRNLLPRAVTSSVDTTRSIYEKRLQRYLDKGATPRPLASPMNNNTAEFSATEEEAENDNEDDYEGTPLQDVPPSRLGLDASGSHLSYGSSYGGVFSSSDIMEGPLTSRTSTSFTGASPPLQMSLRNRAKLATPRNEASSSGNHVKAKAGHQQQQQRKGFSLLLKLALVVAFVGITVLIYANLEYFKFDVPVPTVVKARPK
ncbi:hypothetical protein HPB51_011351 [Rhipicephalus microplus]|uniref:Uncharacterized protein n=1 Tax=Rhipicephalus microplus TaxID=6941 RepID=A0A9J6DGF1_RHIMP|nr:hypothetical protein HPB51_011351 [Rhipicephalus microplus]